ncbi:Cysteine proteinase [Rhynchospora pubera]|uniref:Cysteine proteinase n=1 Tax=Rhynchospora pubera TaxID=906938 RepID=A0AAV8CBT0_9POAL|nr:Cysteine proteinase [Rhynchospora pubera]
MDQFRPFLLLLATLAVTISVSLAQSSADDSLIRQVVSDEVSTTLGAEAHFEIFKTTFGKSYADEEEHDRRFKIFKANLRRAQQHQLLDPTAEHGITKFSDMTPAEFRRTYLGLKKGASKSLKRVLSSASDAPVLPTDNLPQDFDWRDSGAVTDVKDQGSCGSCWSFSTTGALEGANFLANGKLVSLSEQQLVDCDHECDEDNTCDAGCNGGLMTTAFEYVKKSGGLQSESDYPYTGTDGSCKFNNKKIVASVQNFSVVSTNEDQIAANLVKHGPLASNFISQNLFTMTHYHTLISFNRTLISYQISDFFLLCSWNQCRIHADVHRRCIMPIHLSEKLLRPWRVACGLWGFWFLSDPSEAQAILDHKELLGSKLG